MEEYHSQYNQDKFLETNIFKGHLNGVFVDIGAHDGISINNTLFFERERGWSGINVEPIDSVYDKLVKNRPKCLNINCAIANNEGETDFYKNTGYTEMLSGIKSNFDPRHLNRLNYENKTTGSKTEVIKVRTKKLSTIFRENNIINVNYISIDVEGAEFEVIKSIDYDSVFIDVIGFEDNYPNVSVHIVDFLREKGFKHIGKHGDLFMINLKSIFYQ